MTDRQITYELEKVFGKTESYHWQLSYNEYRVAMRSLIKKHQWRENVDYWGKKEGGQYMKSLSDWLMSRSRIGNRIGNKPITEYKGEPEYKMDYVVINDEIITIITKGDEIWYETHVMYSLGYDTYDITDSHLAYFGGKNNVYNCGYNFGSFCKVKGEVKLDTRVVDLTPRELYRRALNNKHSDAHYKKLVAIYLAIERLQEEGKHFFVPYRGRRLKINPEIKKLASELSYYSVNTFNNRLVMFYITILIDWGLIECNLDDIDKIVIK